MVIILNFSKMRLTIFNLSANDMKLNKLIEPENPDPEPFHSRKAILWGEDDLLTQAISLFLKSDTNWDVIRISRFRGVDDLIKEMERINPEVVILSQEKVEENSTLPMRLIDERPCLKVISVGLESNLLQVYSKQKVVLQGASDLLSIIESGYFPNCAGKEAGSKKT